MLPNLAPQTGLDTDVQKFLIDTTTMPDFLLAIKTIIDISIVKYLERGFTDLSINFGCTGGRHRSVYAAQTTVDYLKKKYVDSVNISITHTNI
jgi:RNase adaptor protein for sRNA GlmZ degradation